MKMSDTAPPHWRAAEAAARTLGRRPSDRRTLLLLARLPLLGEAVLERLAGLRGGASVYRSLRRLAEDGLVAAVRPPLHPGQTARLWYLTDLGIAAIALDQRVEPEPIARRNGLRRDDLLSLLSGLPRVLATYTLLGALAASHPGSPDLLAWERPWRRRYQRPTAKAPVTITLPAYAAFSWDETAGAFLLLPDLGTAPPRLHRPALDGLLVLRALHQGELPALVIATTDHGRAAAWRALLEETRRTRSEAPLATCVATWDDLRARPEILADGAAFPQREGAGLVQHVRLRPLRPRRPDAPTPRFVGDGLGATASAARGRDGPGVAALGLTSSDRRLLDTVGRRPFLPSEALAVVLDWSLPSLLRRRDRLIAQGLLRLLGREETRASGADRELVEATAAGLSLVASGQGLTLAAAVGANGLAGGGPGRPIGARRQLLAHLEHTLGADAVFVRFIATARELAAMGADDALAEWRNAAACCRRPIRPDGYGIYRRAGRLFGFFLEYDRGTMSARDYREKFSAYHAYWESGRYERDYDGFPTILVVTRDSSAEERIVRAAIAASVGRVSAPPLLLTCWWRIDDRRNSRGLLGPIWREAASADRRCWPLGALVAMPSLGRRHERPRTARDRR